MPLALPIVSKFDPRGINDARSGLDSLHNFAKTAGAMLAGAFTAAAVGVGYFTAASLRAADESWRVSNALEQAAKNAGVFGNSDADIQKATDALKDHAQTLGELIGVDDEVLLSIEKTWMAVPTLAALGTKGIEHLAEVAANVAAGTGKDIETIGLAFIKIAGDSETAMTKLTRQGVVFTDAQKEAYQALLDTGDEIGAQAYLIDQLDAKYAGMAEAAASPLDRINQMWQNFQETIGTALMPALEKLAPLLGAALAEMVADPEFQKFLEDLTDAFIQLLPEVLPLLPAFMELVKVSLPAIIDALPLIIQMLELLTPLMSFLVPVLQAWETWWSALLSPFEWIGKFLEAINNHMKQGTDLRRDMLTWAKTQGPIIETLTETFLNLAKALSDTWKWWRDLLGLPQPNVPSGGNGAISSYRPGGLKLAEGGIVMPRPGGTMATIGEGGQAEAVIPLNRLGSMMGGGGGGAVYNINVSTLKADASVGEIIVNAIKKYERTSGAVFAGA